ncbi:MAG: SRPBCC domain-containing protein [Chloroflexi bacterium]|nr:SRPBCC domain-containing protein [Chloroflexota bacterium]
MGQTRSQGWEIGVRRTVPMSAGRAWGAIMAALGLDWAYDPESPPFERGRTFITDDGTRGEIRSFEQGSLLRMKWQPPGWEVNTTLQIRVLPAKKGSTISIHHEWLKDGEMREAMRARWTALLEAIEKKD